VTDAEILARSDAIYLDTSVFPKLYLQETSDNGPAILFFSFSRVPLYCSLVVVGEFISVMGLKRTQAAIGVSGYLHRCLALLHDLESGRLRHVEPARSGAEFFPLADSLVAAQGGLGGGDVWHLMAATHLRQQFPSSALFSYDADLVKGARRAGIAAVYGCDVETVALEEALRTAQRWAVHPADAAEQRDEGAEVRDG
jgi:hypothetical protein